MIVRLAAAAMMSASAAAQLPPEARWLASGADIAAALTGTPGECVRPSDDPSTDYFVEIGRVAFMSPLLLGGQAARGGLSCNSCHVDGHGNPDFFLAGLSAAPGTADVTSSIFSKVRDDGVFNPVAIPTLIGVREKPSFGTAAPQSSLHAFIGSAVTDEFQGAPTPPPVLQGLVAYIEAMSADACPSTPTPLTPSRAMADVTRALAAASQAADKSDPSTADFLIVSAQAAVGRVHARFPGDEFGKTRAELSGLSKRIGDARNKEGQPRILHDLQREAAQLGEGLEKSRRGSLYDAETLARQSSWR